MVAQYLKELQITLTDSEIAELAKRTRGKIEADIKESVDDYTKTGKYPKELSHRTNTCDPYTGNWEEHFMDPYYLARILSRRGSKACVLNGYYGQSRSKIKRNIGKFMNIFISTFNKPGIKIAPFYIIYRKGDQIN